MEILLRMSGHIIDMVNRMKQNKIAKRKKFKGDNRAMRYTEKLAEATEYTFPQVSEYELSRVKTEIRENSQRNRRTSFYILLISIALVALTAVAFLRFY